MRCEQALADRRAPALAAALLAITLNFLQPLIHAALMRDGTPTTLWSAFCTSTPDQRQDGQRQEAPLAADKHECCLGLAHAVAFAAPAMAVVLGEAVAVPQRPLSSNVATAVGTRDGPHRPRGPPSFV